MQNVEFSLAGGSALIRQLRRLGLLRWIPQNLTGQIMLAVLIAWVPLLLFTAHEGMALGGKVQIPFLADLVQYARFLVALPCAIAMGEYINPRLRSVLNSFLKSGIVSRKDFVCFESAISRARTLAGSIISEWVILVLVYLYTSLGLYRHTSEGISSWNHPGHGALVPQTAAGWWFLWVSMPLFLFAWFVWVWRLGIWAYLLFRISRLELSVVALHPDQVGGLNFVHVGMRRFSVLVFAISSILCASIGEQLVFNGASLRSYELELASLFPICLGIILGPLVVFTPILVRSKLEHWAMYGPLAGRYVRAFQEKWISHPDSLHRTLLGSPDIQSLADMRNSYAGIAQTRTWLPNRTTIGIFAVAYVLPALPLLTSVISLRQLLSEVYTLLLK
ncbi:MAG TPA: hypothetical protein VGK48_23865 [Terriglobia bacterium]